MTRSRDAAPLLPWLFLGAAFCAIPLVSSSPVWIGFWTLAMMYAALAQSWNLLGGYAGQRSFGHALFFGVGAYASGVLQMRLGVNAWPAAAAGVAAAGAAAALVGYLSFRSGLRGSYFALVTLAFAEIARVVANSVGFTGGAAGLLLPLQPSVSNMQFADRTGAFYLALAVAAACTAVVLWLDRSRFGSQLVAIRENEDAARALGIDAFRLKVQAITLSGAMAGAAGIFYLQLFLYLDPGIAFGAGVSVEALLAPIIGGAGTVAGPIIGAVALRALGEGVNHFTGNAPGLNMVVYGTVLLLVVRFLPDGLVSLGRLHERLRRDDRPLKAETEEVRLAA